MIYLGYFLFGIGVGAIVGYLIFYFRYKDRVTIDRLRENYKICKKELEEKVALVDSLEKEKKILIKEINSCSEQLFYLTQILKDNEIYLKKIKEAAKKTKELYMLLRDFDEDIVNKVKQLLDKIDPSCNITEDSSSQKKIF